MAGDWIKMEHDLPDKPEVVAMATALGIDRFAVVGRLHRIWSWFDRHTNAGSVAGVTPAFLDSLVAHEGFAAEMVSVGWLTQRSGHISVPKFDRHISKSAKERALTAERVKRSRNATDVTEPLPEKRTEQKRTEEKKDRYLRSVQRSGDSARANGADLAESADHGYVEVTAEASHLAGELFRKIGYGGNDGRLIWQSAILVRAGKLPETWVRDAAQGTYECGTKNPVGYFRKVLQERCTGAHVDLKRMLTMVKLPPGKFVGPPRGMVIVAENGIPAVNLKNSSDA